MSDKYVTIDWNTSKNVKNAQANYEAAYKAMKEADMVRKAAKALEMARNGLIPAGTMPVFKTRPWDGVVQCLEDDAGNIQHEAPKAPKAPKGSGRTI